MEKLKQIKVYGMELPVFIFFTAIICICIVCGIVPTQMVGAIADRKSTRLNSSHP